MWNSPAKHSDSGKRYTLTDISVLIYPLDQLFDSISWRPVSQVVEEAILQPLEKEEFVYAVFQVMQAMLEGVAIPKGGHTGIQEAIVAELLEQTCEYVQAEVEEPDSADYARRAAWKSVEQLLVTEANPMPWILEDAGMTREDMSAPKPYLSDKLTVEVWGELFSDSGLWDEFLWDVDWRFGAVMDLPPEVANSLAKTTGIDLDVVQALAHTPTPAEFQTAERYLRRVILEGEKALELK